MSAFGINQLYKRACGYNWSKAYSRDTTGFLMTQFVSYAAIVIALMCGGGEGRIQRHCDMLLIPLTASWNTFLCLFST